MEFSEIQEGELYLAEETCQKLLESREILADIIDFGKFTIEKIDVANKNSLLDL